MIMEIIAGWVMNLHRRIPILEKKAGESVKNADWKHKGDSEMQRIIKLRYTVKRENGYVFSNIFSLDEIERGAVIVWANVNIVDLEKVTKDQFTGLRDKNGKEIYEGDIVKANIYSDEDSSTLLVYYEKSMFVIDYKDSDGDFMPVGYFPGCLEIIGNVHENPELLQGDKA
jgi:uncharacterized phage protein (TIGR01671 family)